MPTFKTGKTEYKISTHALKELRKQIKLDAKYLERHQIMSHEAIVDILNALAADSHLAAMWNERKVQSLNERERVKLISSMLVFPAGNSRAQAEAKVRGSIKLGQPMSFTQVLRGEYDVLVKEGADALRDAGYDSSYIKMYIGEKYFGGDSPGEKE